MLTQTDKANDLAGRFGGSSGGEFAPAGTPISELAQEYGTPFYLYHGEMISERVSRVREALGTEVSYSVKANPSLGVCQLVASEREAGAEDRQEAARAGMTLVGGCRVVHGSPCSTTFGRSVHKTMVTGSWPNDHCA